MGGEVGVFSEGENKGSTFWITLPKGKNAKKEEKKQTITTLI